MAIRLAGIEGGIECAKLAPQLSALADGEASAEDLALLRPHMKTCLACRAKLREFRTAPKRVAALVPSAALPADPGPLQTLWPRWPLRRPRWAAAARPWTSSRTIRARRSPPSRS